MHPNADTQQKHLLHEVLQTTKRLQTTIDLSITVLGQVQRRLGLNEINASDTTKEDVEVCL